MLLYFIRHGDPIYNPDQLTEKGVLQAKALSHRLYAAKIDRIFSSSSRRAIQTAEPTAAALNKKIEILDWCNECYTWMEFSFTDSNGEHREWFTNSQKYMRIMNSDEVRALGFEWYRHEAFRSSGCESGMRRVSQNADEWLKSLGYTHDLHEHLYRTENDSNERIALFAHGGFGNAFLAHILDIPYPMMARFGINHTGMTVIDFHRTDGVVIPQVMQWSGDSHLYKEGLPTKFCNGIDV